MRLHIKRLVLEVGYFRNNPFRLFTLAILDRYDDYLTIINISIYKFTVEIGWELEDVDIIYFD